MSNTDVNDNLNKLVEKISEISEIKEVVTYYKNLIETPQAVILYRSTDEEDSTTLNIESFNGYKIVVRWSFENTQLQEKNVRDVSQLVLNKLRSNRNLDGTVEKVTMDGLTVDTSDIDDKVREVTINVTVQNFNKIL